MSHKATKWLASLEPKRTKSGAFRVLFHLCNCHNPGRGCFPGQDYLKAVTGLSNGGLNDNLNDLEKSGLIRRYRRVNSETGKRLPTRYMLGFEKGFVALFDEAKEGDNPSPETGDGTNSSFTPDPSPVLGKNHLHSTGDKPVKEPVINQRARATDADGFDETARFWVKKIRQGKTICASAISPQMARRMLELELVEENDLRKLGIPF